MKTILILFSTLVIVSCGQKSNNERIATQGIAANSVSLTQEQMTQGDIVLDIPELRSLTRMVRVSGSIEAPPGNIISVSFPFGGYVRKINLLPGTRVNRGEALVTLDDPQYIQLQQDYLLAKSKLSLLQAEYERQKELNSDKTASDKAYQQVTQEYESQSILLKGLSEKLKLINVNPEKLNLHSLSGRVNIYSPINGYVTDIFVNTGQYISATDVLFELVDPSDVHVILNVFEKDISAITVGQMVTCYSNTQPDKKYLAKIHLISKRVKADRTIEVHCDFIDTRNKDFIPGMFVNAEVELVNQQVIAVPDDAVVTSANKPYVFLAKPGNVFELFPVTTGLQANGFTEIKTPLDRQQVVIKNAYTILMQLKSAEEN